jgi:hypothetical protein
LSCRATTLPPPHGSDGTATRRFVHHGVHVAKSLGHRLQGQFGAGTQSSAGSAPGNAEVTLTYTVATTLTMSAPSPTSPIIVAPALLVELPAGRFLPRRTMPRLGVERSSPWATAPRPKECSDRGVCRGPTERRQSDRQVAEHGHVNTLRLVAPKLAPTGPDPASSNGWAGKSRTRDPKTRNERARNTMRRTSVTTQDIGLGGRSPDWCQRRAER